MGGLELAGVYVGMLLLCGWGVAQADTARKKAGAPPIKVNPVAKWLVIAAIAGVATAGIAWLNSFK